MKAARVSLVFASIAVACAAAFAYAWEPAIGPVRRPAASAFDPALVAHGAKLAAVGNCVSCHTVPGGRSFAGGLPIRTPFGTIHSTNITPHETAGIGAWSEAAFVRSMREGVGREGEHLYPAFPYDHTTLVTNADNRALYAYLMTRAPADSVPPPNDLPFPLTLRPVIAGWKLLFFREGAFEPDPTRSAQLNRGAYLAEGLGHCGSCHTPRNVFGAEKRDEHWAGGEADGWKAYAIDAGSHAPIPWTEDTLYGYLRNGWHAAHGVARGPMAEVTGNLGSLSDDDVRAIAAYNALVMGQPAPERQAKAKELARYVVDGSVAPAEVAAAPPVDPANRGEAVYRAACASCHEAQRPQPYGGLNLHLSTAIAAPDPQNVVTVTLFGLPPGDGQRSSIMPGYAASLTDADLVALLGYMRETYTDRAPWTDLDRIVADTRSGRHRVAVRPADGIERAPANVGARDR